jgi:hypothetical protein
MKKLPDMSAAMPIEPADWIKDSNLIRQWKAMKEEVDRFKWLESEKAGHDIGWDRAWTQWMTHRKTDRAQ